MGVVVMDVAAQTESMDYGRIGFAAVITPLVTDYQCVGINPANLGFQPVTEVYKLSTPLTTGITRKRRSWSIGIGEAAFSVNSDALARPDLLDALTQTTSTTFSRQDQLKAAEAFANKGLRFSVEGLGLGLAYQSQWWGGIALTVREKVSGSFMFNESAAKLAFQGRYFEYFDSVGVNWRGDSVGYARNPQRFSTLFNGTRLGMNWYREFALSYGVRLVKSEGVDVYVGASAKYLTGYAFLDAEVRSGALVARSALSPLFDIDYGNAITPSRIEGNAFVPVGQGFGFDVGLTVRAGEKLTVAASVVDIGYIRWDGNVFQAKDTILNGLSSEGFASYNIFEEAPKITGEGKFFIWEGLLDVIVDLPTRTRVGIAWQHNKHWRFGLDAVVPGNAVAGALGQPIVSTGVDYRPLSWLRLGTGIGNGGNMGTFIPISISFSLFGGLLETGLASRDIVTFFTTQRPVVSAVIGVVRARF
ncbi:MAG: hypothetical protein FGM24_07240 [Candidatus Kapabacteria bacterium]|nr:hypothetical protein [Candidatus Kapabacteria bacterium]